MLLIRRTKLVLVDLASGDPADAVMLRLFENAFPDCGMKGGLDAPSGPDIRESHINTSPTSNVTASFSRCSQTRAYCLVSLGSTLPPTNAHRRPRTLWDKRWQISKFSLAQSELPQLQSFVLSYHTHRFGVHIIFHDFDMSQKMTIGLEIIFCKCFSVPQMVRFSHNDNLFYRIRQKRKIECCLIRKSHLCAWNIPCLRPSIALTFDDPFPALFCNVKFMEFRWFPYRNWIFQFIVIRCIFLKPFFYSNLESLSHSGIFAIRVHYQPTTNLFVFLRYFAGMGTSNFQVMLIGRLPSCFT